MEGFFCALPKWASFGIIFFASIGMLAVFVLISIFAVPDKEQEKWKFKEDD